MKCIVIGAGNAGRPAARILNYIGHHVQITDQKKLEDLPLKAQEILLQMEKEGVELNLGLEKPLELDKSIQHIFPPQYPKNHL